MYATYASVTKGEENKRKKGTEVYSHVTRSLMLGITLYAVTGCHSLWDSLELLFNWIMVAATSASMSVFQAEIRKKEQTGYA